MYTYTHVYTHTCIQVEANIPTPKRETDKPFLMPVEDIFSISGRGTVCSGRIEQGMCAYIRACML